MGKAVLNIWWNVMYDENTKFTCVGYRLDLWSEIKCINYQVTNGAYVYQQAESLIWWKSASKIIDIPVKVHTTKNHLA